MPHYRKLVGQKCYLSPATLEDAGYWTRWENDLQVALPLGDEAYTLTSLEKIHEDLGELLKLQRPIFTIIDLETDQPIGRCLLFNLDPVNRKAMVGILIGEKEFQNRGYGQEALRLLLEYAFILLNLNNVTLGVFEFNAPAIRCYEKVGFKEIGRQRQGRIIGGQKFDVVWMDILAEEFHSPAAEALAGLRCVDSSKEEPDEAD